MAKEVNDSVEPAAVPHGVATGRSAKTPTIAIGAMMMIIAVLFVLALGLAALAYWFAS
jgi:hypothetical protein